MAGWLAIYCRTKYLFSFFFFQILMPYPIYKDGVKGGEFLLLGTRKADNLVEESRDGRGIHKKHELFQ
jgi:hypothetical protein